ncbi:MAG: metallophosphoesterase [Gaiellaceae bacterium]
MRLRTLDVPVAGLPPELAGYRIVHLSDFHLGVPSRGRRAVRRAVEWAEERQSDLVCITGDLLTRPEGAEELRALMARLPGAVAVLGNHDVGHAKDPACKRSDHVDHGVTVLRDEAVRIGAVQVVGVDPGSYLRRTARPRELADPEAGLRILLCHFPGIRGDGFDLVLAGHFHDGQIAIPYGFGKLRLGELGIRHPRGLYGKLHVSAGLGTTFVPFRFFARPEATELVLQPA